MNTCNTVLLVSIRHDNQVEECFKIFHVWNCGDAYVPWLHVTSACSIQNVWPWKGCERSACSRNSKSFTGNNQSNNRNGRVALSLIKIKVDYKDFEQCLNFIIWRVTLIWQCFNITFTSFLHVPQWSTLAGNRIQAQDWLGFMCTAHVMTPYLVHVARSHKRWCVCSSVSPIPTCSCASTNL